MPYLICDRCRTLLPAASINTPDPVECPGCHAPLLAKVFPAFFRAPIAAQASENLGSDEDASCFYHPNKKAVVPCQQCGRFLCGLCDLEVEGRHLCPGCLSSNGGKDALQNGGALPRRAIHDRLALALAVLPLIPFFWFFTILTAPVALFFVIRYWNEPRQSLIPHGRWRLVVAGVLALAQIAFWVVIVYYARFHVDYSSQMVR